jgi:hypothetical protein
MNILLSILLVIVGIIALLLIIALFSKKDYAIEREAIINKSVHEVFNYIRFLKNQDHFSIWAMMDPEMKKSYVNTDGIVGFVYAWDGNKKAGKGEQEIKNIIEDRSMDTELRFIKPFEGIAQTYFITEPISPNQTHIKWGMKSKMKYPMNAFLLFQNMDKLMGEGMQTGLTTLKGILEK